MRATIMLANIATIVFLFGMFFVQKDINFALMAFALVGLGLLGEVAINEQESFDKAELHHRHENIVQCTDDGGTYVHSVYQHYKSAGMSNISAFNLMQEKTKHLCYGDLYKPFDVKPTLVTRVLMTKVGGVK